MHLNAIILQKKTLEVQLSNIHIFFKYTCFQRFNLRIHQDLTLRNDWKNPTGKIRRITKANGLVAPPSQSLADEISKVKSLWDAMREDFTKVWRVWRVWFGCMILDDVFFWNLSGQFITTSAEVTPNGGLVRESPPKWP